MRIVVFGASGSVGGYLLTEALKRGHEVVAVTRNRSRIPTRHSGLKVVESELGDAPRIQAALKGSDATIVSLGDSIVVEGTRAIVTAMKHTGVRRIEALTGFATSSQSRKRLALPMRMLVSGVRLMTRGEFAAKERQDAIIRVSGLDYTIVQPPTLTSGSPTGTYRHGNYRGKSIFGTVTRADLAAFMVDNLQLARYVHESVYVQA